MAGNCVLKKYDPQLGGLAYVLKSLEMPADRRDDYDIDFELLPQHRLKTS